MRTKTIAKRQSTPSADRLWDEGHLRASFRQLSILSQEGDSGAQGNLGYFFECGIGTERNLRLARHWYRKAAANGNSCGSYNIAILEIQSRRYTRAVPWLRKAARQGEPAALIRLAELHMSGRGTYRSIARAKTLVAKVLASNFTSEFDREEAAQVLASISEITGAKR